MLPRIQIAIRRHDFANLATLEYLAMQLERTLVAEKTYRPLLSPKQFIFPHLAYHLPSPREK